jgi:mRNA interferase HigB
MKNIVSRKKLRDFWVIYPESEQTLKTWYKVVMKSQWKSSNDIKMQYKNASIVGNNRVVFNICGNKYRLIAKFNYEMQWCWIRFVGTHAQYDKIDSLTI